MNEVKRILKNIFIGSMISSHLVKSRLEDIGIKVIIKDHLHSSNISELEGEAPENLELYVHEDHFIKANEVINQLIKEGKLS